MNFSPIALAVGTCCGGIRRPNAAQFSRAVFVGAGGWIGALQKPVLAKRD